MFNSISLILILEVILLMLSILLSVAYVTVAERKTMASMQRRLGPTSTGFWGILQAFADALKLIIKEYVGPTQANKLLFFLGPINSLFFALTSFAVIPFGPFSFIAELKYGILFVLAVSSVATYGILLGGWSANSKFAFLGSIRSTAQLIAYELVLSSVILLIIMITSSLNLNTVVQFQNIVWLALPLLPLLIIFFIGALAETNRGPFDLSEAESELVSGFMTEHSAMIFVMFFLAEYSSVLLMCNFTSSLFLGGYLLDLSWFMDVFTFLMQFLDPYLIQFLDPYLMVIIYKLSFSFFPALEGLIPGLFFGIKSSMLVFMFIWIRASQPRIRFDQLMSFCWCVLLPLLFAFIILVPCLLYSFDAFVSDFSLLAFMPLFYGRSDTILSNSSVLPKGVAKQGAEYSSPRPTLRALRWEVQKWFNGLENHGLCAITLLLAFIISVACLLCSFDGFYCVYSLLALSFFGLFTLPSRVKARVENDNFLSHASISHPHQNKNVNHYYFTVCKLPLLCRGAKK